MGILKGKKGKMRDLFLLPRKRNKSITYYIRCQEAIVKEL